jgi:hypothetical protein
VPDWIPNWNDVRFDHAAVARAADACEHAARLLAEASATRQRARHQATVRAEGPAVQHLVHDATALDRRDHDMVTGLRSTAVALRSASDHARREQAGRLADRLRWQLEADRERLAAAPPAMAGPAR